MKEPSLLRLLFLGICAGWATGAPGSFLGAVALAIMLGGAGSGLLLCCRRFGWVACGALLTGVGTGSACALMVTEAQRMQKAALPARNWTEFVVEGDLGRTKEGFRTVFRTTTGCRALILTKEQYGPGRRLLAKVTRQSFRAPASPVGFDEGKWLRGQGIRERYKPDIVLALDTETGGRWRLLRELERYQNALVQRCAAVGDARTEGLMRAISTGDKAGMSREVKRAFGRLGLSHLTAVSGFHVGLVAVLAMWLLKLSGTARRKRALAAIPAVWSFVGLCGFSGSAVRAALMLTLAALASFLHRRPEGLTLLSIAGCAMFAIAPHMASSLGVRMSFLATAGILMWVRRWRGIPLEGWRSKAVMALGVPAVATAFTAPVAWPAFGQVPILFLPANVLATPFVPLLMAFILIWVLAPEAALPLLSPAFVTVFNGVVHAVERCAQWAPPALLPLDQFWVTVAGCILCFGTAWALMIRKGVPVFLGGLLLTMALLRGQGGREMAPHCMQIGWEIVCLGGHPPEVFPLRPGKNGNSMKWETRSFLERVSHGSPVVGTRCGDGLVIGACHLRYRHRDGTWQQVSSSRSHSE